ncbi:hypothetical protein CDL15_Pgr020558 [Punica granatum]|uniref:Uncharacterized protein n=1 Tax=Punica granatum TaxID=22663 RepID=A0A218VX68_PUNGR|nr:hypothetical protein CDL15_Pgr020558 [Punica granatum]PKI60982.1 hypothetical protein CRG98_018612 [Punica granatum]
MASSTLALYDPQFSCTPPPTNAESQHVGSESNPENTLPFFSAFCPPYSNLDQTPLDQEQDSDGFLHSAYRDKEDSDCRDWFFGSNPQLVEHNEGEEPPYNGHENWLNGPNFTNHWQESFFLVGNDLAHDNGQSGVSRRTGEGLPQSDTLQSESYYKEEETRTPYAYESLSGYWSWLEKYWEEHSQDFNNGQEPQTSVNGLELYESIFGYWPCISRE